VATAHTLHTNNARQVSRLELTQNTVYRIPGSFGQFRHLPSLAMIFSIKNFCNTKIAGLGKTFILRKFPCIWYL
jgi:hypothetical protein